MLDAAKAMKLSARDLLELNVIDEIIDEPIGGAHRDKNLILESLRKSINHNLEQFKNKSGEEIFVERKNKFLKIGRNKGFISNSEDISTLTIKDNNVVEILKSKKIIIGSAVLGLILLIAVISFV